MEGRPQRLDSPNSTISRVERYLEFMSYVVKIFLTEDNL
jgi:hypothetical protein